MNTPDIPPLIPPVLSSAQTMTVRFSLSRRDVFICRLRVLARNRFIVSLLILTSFLEPLREINDPSMAERPLAFRIFFFFFLAGIIFLSWSCSMS
jgi:hypothetical protein